MKKKELSEVKEETNETSEVDVNTASLLNESKYTLDYEPDGVVSCLQNKRIAVRFIPKIGKITNPKHVFYGGMGETAKRTFVVPRTSTGKFAQVLTQEEQIFLEDYMGLAPGTMSPYRKEFNFWSDANEDGISRVSLGKYDNYFDLSNPEEYIKYKILLANKDYIAESLKYMEDHPKATYQFVVVDPDEETKVARENMSTTMRCYKEYGKIEEDKDTLRTIIEILEGKPTAKTSKLEMLQAKINGLIQADSKLFLRVITDKLLPSKVFIKRCIEEGIIVSRDNHLYVRATNAPLCEFGEEATLNVAAAYLQKPKNQDLKFTLEAKLNN